MIDFRQSQGSKYCSKRYGDVRGKLSRVKNVFYVAGAVLERDAGLLLVRNLRRNGSHDWSTPGGVIDPTDSSTLHGLSREVEEETGLRVLSWSGLLYEVVATSLDLGWEMRCEVHLAAEVDGDITINDPDGIVDHAAFISVDDLGEHLELCFPWVREPLTEWLSQRWPLGEVRSFRYEVTGSSLSSLVAKRIV